MTTSYVHGTSTVPLLGETIGANLRRTVERVGDHEALVVRSPSYRATYRELWDQTTTFARALLASGIRPRDRVGIWAPNRFEWVLLQYATARIGAILVNINPAYKSSELRHALAHSGVRLLLLARAFRESDYVSMLAEVGRAVHGALRRADDVHRRAGARAVRRVRSVVAAHRDHGGLAVSGGGDEEGAVADAHARGDDLLRDDGDVAVVDAERARRPAAQARRDGGAAEGYVNIVGRIKDMIIRGGENVYPREVEEFLHTHPDVVDVQVIGVPSERSGEEVMAWVRLRAGSSASVLELNDYCRGRMASYKIPRYWKFVDEFPTTVTGKVQKFRMREMAIAELRLEVAAAVETA
jgi:acyl-CoA synthetase (AMP-forming)/AMP-acid ligase II